MFKTRIPLAQLLLVSVLTGIAIAQASPSNSSPKSTPNVQNVSVSPLFIGVAWYPEQWPEERWEKDLALMQAAGITMVRVGEFAWSRMEPAEGKFDLDWLDRAIKMAAARNIKVVVGTPTAAPPAWLTKKYPEVLPTWEDGRRATHGNRGHYRFTSERYLQLCRRVAEEMAKRFGHNPNVIGWQIDNEYGPVSYDDETKVRFQAFLRQKYQTLDRLNGAWTTYYWSQTYDSWDEIPIPVGYHNPGLMLEWKRFISVTFRDYQHNQISAIRASSDPRQFITHNFMGFYPGFDHYTVAAELDFASWDSYVGQGQLDYMWNAQTHDLTRGFKRRNFWIMETQPGSVNWAGINNTLDRGEMRKLAWQAIGHGADTVSYWQWRSALGGQEQYHGSLVGADGNPRPVYEEISQIAREVAKAASALKDTTPAPETAVLFDYDSRWAVDFQKHNRNFDPIGYLSSIYRPLRELTQDVDIVHPSAPLDKYKLVVAPALNLMPRERAEHLAAYVRGGGHLVLGVRSGMKDENNALLPSRQPGTILSELLGGDVVDFYALDKDFSVTGKVGSGQVKNWAEMLEAKQPGVDVVLKFGTSNGWLDDKPAVITRKVGKGSITYIGAWLDEKLTRDVLASEVSGSGVKQILPGLPSGVEVSRRVSTDGKTVLIVINHTRQQQQVTLPRPMRSLLDGQQKSSLDLPPSEVVVLASE
ncbi:MAG TPA: beta-galactosidase [Terriglobales bacterium]|nr:beta-galactosidase [Terriglobales bacterium]